MLTAAGLVVAAWSARATPPCAPWLESSRYGLETSAALHGFPSVRPTLRAEAGSIAALDPRVLPRLRELTRAIDANGGAPVLEAASRGLEDLAGRGVDRRLVTMIERLVPALDHAAEVLRLAPAELVTPEMIVRNFESKFWELMVACLYSGERIELGQRLSVLYPELTDWALDREIDVAVQTADGAWRWVEVKNWRVRAIERSRNRHALMRQAAGSARSRSHLWHERVTRELVLRLPPTPETYEMLRIESGYDHILFIFPQPGLTLLR